MIRCQPASRGKTSARSLITFTTLCFGSLNQFCDYKFEAAYPARIDKLMTWFKYTSDTFCHCRTIFHRKGEACPQRNAFIVMATPGLRPRPTGRPTLRPKSSDNRNLAMRRARNDRYNRERQSVTDKLDECRTLSQSLI